MNALDLFIHKFVPGRNFTLLLLHGTGGNESDLIPLGQMLEPDAALLSPRGQVSEHGMPRFFKRFAEGVFDVEDLKARTNQLADFIRAAAVHYEFHAEKIIPVGYSNGANIAASMILTGAFQFPAAVLLRPMTPFVPDTFPNLSKTKILISAGTADPSVPPENTHQLAKLFRTAGATVTLNFEEAGHQLTQRELQPLAKNWLADLSP